MSGQFLITFLVGLLPVLPVIATAIIGLVLCRRRLSQSHPKAHARAATGWVLLIAFFMVGQGASVLIAFHAAQSPDRMAFVKWLSITNVASQLILLASAIMLLQAILADRDDRDAAVRGD